MTDNEQHPAEDKSPLMTRRKFLKLLGFGTAEVVLMGVGGFIYSGWIEPNALTVTDITMPITNLPEAFDGYRLVQISDIHAGTWMNTDRLMTVVNRINDLNADLVAITGDYLTIGKVDWIADILINPLQSLQAKDGVVSVLGNHDHWTDGDAVSRILKTANVLELKNDSIVLERDSAKLAIAGVDDVWEGLADLDAVASTLPERDVPAILLAHEPDFADASAETGRFALQISGHSHGGQVRLPILGAPMLPKFGKKYPIGQYQVRDMVQYTNRGVGMIPPTVRFGCPPEITVFTLTPKVT